MKALSVSWWLSNEHLRSISAPDLLLKRTKIKYISCNIKRYALPNFWKGWGEKDSADK